MGDNWSWDCPSERSVLNWLCIEIKIKKEWRRWVSFAKNLKWELKKKPSSLTAVDMSDRQLPMQLIRDGWRPKIGFFSIRRDQRQWKYLIRSPCSPCKKWQQRTEYELHMQAVDLAYRKPYWSYIGFMKGEQLLVMKVSFVSYGGDAIAIGWGMEGRDCLCVGEHMGCFPERYKVNFRVWSDKQIKIKTFTGVLLISVKIWLSFTNFVCWELDYRHDEIGG